jgi:predicted RNase H-like HicB family nuclease
MELGYNFYKSDNWYVGRLDDYPDYETQGATLEELEEMLRELYKDLVSGEIPGVRQHGTILV